MENNVSAGNSRLSASLRFSDAGLEREFQARYFRDNVGYVRAALVLAIVAWAFFALVSAPPTGQETYLLIHLVGISRPRLSRPPGRVAP